MSKSPPYQAILGPRLTPSFKLCQMLDRRSWLPGFQAFLAGIARERDAQDWEWRGELAADGCTFELHFAAPRIVTKIGFAFESPLREHGIVVRTWDGAGWCDETVDTTWETTGNEPELLIHFRRLVVTPRVAVQVDSYTEGGANIAPKVARHRYQDVEHLAISRQALDSGNHTAAEQHLHACLALAPSHFTAALGLARVFESQKRWADVRCWAMMAFAHSRGGLGGDLLHTSCEQESSDLPKEVPPLRESAADWDVGAHHGAICLLNERTYWLGFDKFHLARTRQVIEIRRRAAARLLRQLHFDYTDDNERLVFARLRVLRNDGQVSDVSIEQLSILDDPDQNPAVRTQHRRRAFFHLPEVDRGDCIELEYALIHSHLIGPDEKPDIFIMADLNCDFPTRRSVTQVKCPRDWDLTCIGLHDAPEPTQRDDSDRWKIYECIAERLFYDEWGTIEMERKYRSPHLCCAWGGRSWRDAGEFALKNSCHSPREDSLPDALRAVLDGVEGKTEQLRAGFEWVRDRLKYMSLRSAKQRSNAPDLAKQIVAAGVADCMDKAYLVLLICRHLGIAAEYIVAASETGYIVKELPASQFDHILVRAELNGEWIYLDGTSPQTPFGWIPPYLQGLRVQRLGSDFELLTIPEESPEMNTIAIRETLRCTAEGQLTGEFAIEAKGFPARWWDEHWKGASMTSLDPYRAASLALRQQLPSATLADWTSPQLRPRDEVCSFAGSHSRRSLLPIDGGQIGIVDWHTPLFPLYHTLERNWSGLTVFPLPISYSISCRVECSEGWTISGSSLGQEVKTEFGTVTTEVHGTPTALDAKRRLVIGRRFVDAEHAGQISDFLSAWDDAMRLAFILRRQQL